MHANARYYMPELGRFISEDIVHYGSNWYLYCSNNPVNFWDPTGLWDERVHHDVTQKIAEDVGFYGPYAEIIAEADNNVDNDSDTTPFIPDVGNFSWHFNMNTDPNGTDTRIQHSEDCLQLSIELWNQGYKEASLSMLGKGLHPLQDTDAHMGFAATAGLDGNWPHYEGDSFDGDYWSKKDCKNFDELCKDFSVTSDYKTLDPEADGFSRAEGGYYYSYDADTVELYGYEGGQRYQNTVKKSDDYLRRWMTAIYG